MHNPTIDERDELTLMKVRRGVQRMLAVIAKLDGRLVQDITDEALTEYIQRRGITVTMPAEAAPV